MPRFLSIVTLLLALSQLAAQQPAIAQSVESIRIPVSDLKRSVEFFTKVLDFQSQDSALAAQDSKTQRLKLGDEAIELVEFTSQGRTVPADSRSNDLWFQHIAIIVSDMDKAYERLKRNGVKHLSLAPQRLPDWNKNAGGIEAFYFADPDGHPLEILHFPQDKGWAKWHQPTNKLFLGIDHTAIVVSDTRSAVKFYQDQLGMGLVGRSENYGPEQEKLNNVPGARLRITTLKAPRGPAIELLEYLEPRTGRTMPADTRPNDLWHWQIVVITNSGKAASEMRDPDGHALVTEAHRRAR